MNAQLRHALYATACGWHVFPLVPAAKRPALHGVDRCPGAGACASGHVGWEQRATTDPERIQCAWSTTPYNVGIATGPSGLVVVDLDCPKPGQVPPPQWRAYGALSGQDVLNALCERDGVSLPEDTWQVRTPTGGRHLYYRAPAGVKLRNTAGTLGWLIDTRAHGGYVVADGSRTPAGTYDVECFAEPAPLPGWLVDALTPAPLPPQEPVTVELGTGRRAAYLEAAVSRNLDAVRTAPPGQRNRALYGAAVAIGQLIAGGALTADTITPALLATAVAVGQRETEAARTIRSGYRAGANRPRSVAA